MIAIDTNVLVRYLVEDDVAQADRAEAVLRSGTVLLPKSVVLELEWVLRSRYRYDRVAIADGISRVAGLPGMVVEDGAVVAQTVAWYRQGLDFADALHLASSGPAERFATFDRALRRHARGLSGAVPVVVL